MIPRVFISYKVTDERRNAWVRGLYEDLRRNGIDARLDVFEVPPGGSFSDYMTRNIREADRVLFVVTPESVRAVEAGTGAVAFELQIANARRLASGDFSVIPIFREGDTTSTYLQDHRYLDFRDDSRYQRALQELVDWLLGRVAPPPIIPASREDTLYKRAIMRPSGYFGGKQTPVDIMRALKVMGRFTIVGFSTELLADKSTWVAERGTGEIVVDDSRDPLIYERMCKEGWSPPWYKNFFSWSLEWSGETVWATGRFSSSPGDRM